MSDSTKRYLNEEETFEEFLLRCARHCLGIPYEGYYNLQHYDERIEELLKELEYYSNMSVQEAQKLLEEDYNFFLSQYNNYVEEKKELKEHYAELKQKVEAWEPPSPEFEIVKSSALKKLKEKIDTECAIAIDPPKKQDPEEWLKTRISFIKQNLDWFHKERDEKAKKMEQANKWMETLKKSLKEIK